MPDESRRTAEVSCKLTVLDFSAHAEGGLGLSCKKLLQESEFCDETSEDLITMCRALDSDMQTASLMSSCVRAGAGTADSRRPATANTNSTEPTPVVL